jgi:hypothetical protein
VGLLEWGHYVGDITYWPNRVNTTYCAVNGEEINSTMNWEIASLCPPSMSDRAVECEKWPVKRLRYTLVRWMDSIHALSFDITYRND